MKTDHVTRERINKVRDIHEEVEEAIYTLLQRIMELEAALDFYAYADDKGFPKEPSPSYEKCIAKDRGRIARNALRDCIPGWGRDVCPESWLRQPKGKRSKTAAKRARA